MTTFVSAGSTRGVIWNNTPTDALFRAFLTRLKAALDGSGLVQTSDTGQFNLTTVTYPTVANTDATGYFIYRFNDSVQGTYPVFLKVSAGRGTSAGFTRLRVQVGTGTNGAGTLTNVSPPPTAGDEYYTNSADPVCTDYATHSDGFFGLVIAALPTGVSQVPRHWFFIERTRNDAGAFDGRGVVLLTPVAGQPPTQVRLTFAKADGTNPHGDSLGYTLQHSLVFRTATDSGDKVAHPYFYSELGVVSSCKKMFITQVANMPGGANTFTASPFGTSRTWLGLGASSTCIPAIGVAQTTSWGLVFAWE